MTLTMAELFADPDHYLFAFDGDAALFRAMDRAAYARSIFLDGRIDDAGAGVMRVPVAQLLGNFPRAVPETGWIFHIAHCGSTLLARGLDRDDALVLREPLALRQVAAEGAQAGTGDAGWRQGLALVLAMLGRRYDGDAAPVVKANVPVNFILDPILAARPGARAILLHFGLEAYLAAVLRSDNHRAWIAMVTEELRPAIEAAAGPIADLSVAERGAALWLAQMRVFARALAAHPQLVSLDADRLFEAPGPAIAAASAYFGLAPPEGARLASLSSTYAKAPGVAFDNDARRARQAEQQGALADEIDRAASWVRARLAERPLPDRLPRALIGENAPLLTRR